MNEQQSIMDFIRLAERLDKPKRTAQQIYWQDRCDELAVKLNAVMCVVQELTTGNCQVWHEWIVNKSMEKHPIDIYKVVYVSEVQ